MVTGILWFLAIANGLLWLFNGAIALSDDHSGKGMVLMITLPFSVFVGLVSLIIAGFIT